MIVGSNYKRKKVVGGEVFYDPLGLYSEYKYVPPYRCDLHQVPVEDQKREAIEEILNDAEQSSVKRARIVAMVVDAETKTKRKVYEGENMEK